MPLKVDTSILIFMGVIIGMFIVVRLLRSRFKIVVKIMFQILLGGAFILLFNHFGEGIKATIPLNPLTSFIAGVFQLPGVAFLLVVKYIIYA